MVVYAARGIVLAGVRPAGVVKAPGKCDNAGLMPLVAYIASPVARPGNDDDDVFGLALRV